MIFFNGSSYEGVALTDSILLGDGVFETLRSYEGRLFALDSHLQRLEEGISKLELTRSTEELFEREKVISAIKEILSKSYFPNGALRISFYADGNWVLSHKEYLPPSEALRCSLIQEEPEPLAYKSASYSRRLRARRHAQNLGFDDVIFADSNEEVSELSTSNLLARIGGQWVTPRIESGALPGITRKSLIENFGVREVNLTKAALTEAEDVAAISSLREIQGIKEIDGKDTPISNRLRELQESFHTWILGNLLS